MFAALSGRSKNMQTGLRQARESALAELRQEAHALGADDEAGARAELLVSNWPLAV